RAIYIKNKTFFEKNDYIHYKVAKPLQDKGLTAFPSLKKERQQIQKVYIIYLKVRKNMKIKLFKKLPKESLKDFEEQVNEFMATVEVVDVKITMAPAGHSDNFGTVTHTLVLYK
ncbi:hypothetical protein, partial [Streptococcus suis]|uniref:hypothetical protein n=2 Tax=Streptococcus suis TaxID=1307 RepID=UPI00094348E2